MAHLPEEGHNFNCRNSDCFNRRFCRLILESFLVSAEPAGINNLRGAKTFETIFLVSIVSHNLFCCCFHNCLWFRIVMTIWIMVSFSAGFDMAISSVSAASPSLLISSCFKGSMVVIVKNFQALGKISKHFDNIPGLVYRFNIVRQATFYYSY